MKSSGKATRSAPSRCASARAARAFSVLPARSPTVGLSWATAIASRSDGREFMVHRAYQSISDEADALGEREKPSETCDDQSKPDRGRADVLDPADLRIDLAVDPVGELFDRGVEELDHHHEHQDADK